MRNLDEIAQDIHEHWPKMYFRAVPYVAAMFDLLKLSDNYGCAREIVNRFLCNASTWRGEDARRIKAELKQMLKEQGK